MAKYIRAWNEYNTICYINTEQIVSMLGDGISDTVVTMADGRIYSLDIAPEEVPGFEYIDA